MSYFNVEAISSWYCYQARFYQRRLGLQIKMMPRHRSTKLSCNSEPHFFGIHTIHLLSGELTLWPVLHRFLRRKNFIVANCVTRCSTWYRETCSAVNLTSPVPAFLLKYAIFPAQSVSNTTPLVFYEKVRISDKSSFRYRWLGTAVSIGLKLLDIWCRRRQTNGETSWKWPEWNIAREKSFVSGFHRRENGFALGILTRFTMRWMSKICRWKIEVFVRFLLCLLALRRVIVQRMLLVKSWLKEGKRYFLL